MTENKRGRGRPPFYKTSDELRAAVDRYFESCHGEPIFDKNGMPILTRTGEQKIVNAIPPTISGLSIALGFQNRAQFTRQRRRGIDFAEVVQYARLRVEAFNEIKLFSGKTFRGASFVLQNCFGWKSQDETPAQWPDVNVIVRDPADADDSTEAKTPIHVLNIDLLN